MFGRVVRGVVDDVVPASNVYIVRVPYTGAPIHCVALTPMAYPFGARAIGLYPPGTSVICSVWNDKGTPGYGVILGAISQKLAEPSHGVSDWIAPYTGTHAFSDDIDAFIQLNGYQNIESFAVGQPLDAIPGHDIGAMQDFGTGYGAGLLEAWLRASDIAGIWCYYQDNLVRLATYNFDHWHAGGERWIRNDQGEINDVDSLTPYPWEALGVWLPGSPVFVKNEGGGTYKADAQLLYVPTKPDQLGIFRHRKSRGYIGDLCSHEVILPLWPKDVPSTGVVNALSDTERHNFTGLSAVTEHSDGLVSIRSAKGIVLEKYLFIPVARQTAIPEQSVKSGDGVPVDGTAGNYAPGGHTGANVDAHRRTEIRLPANEDRPDSWLGQLYDLHTYVFNWWAKRRTLAHANDWSLPEEGHFAHKEDDDEASEWFGGVYIPDSKGLVSPMSDVYAMDPPAFFDVDVDHTTKSRYYCSRSFIDILPDGTIAVEDGYGSGIYLSQGNIRITCPGDIVFQPGRSFVSMAGDDTVLRTGSSVDITAALGDVRLKAERNLHMLAGNGEIGGVLIEAKSKAISRPTDWLTGKLGEDAITAGIMFKTDRGGPLVFRGSDMRFVAEGADGNKGTMFFEAPGGGIHMEANFITRNAVGNLGLADYVNDSLVLATAGGFGCVCLANKVLFSADKVGFIGDAYVGGSVYAHAGVVPLDNAKLILDDMEAQASDWTDNVVGNASVLQYLTDAKNRTEWMLDARFTFRTPEQYGTEMEGFYLVESRWQRTYRERGTGLGFIEPPVTIGYGENAEHTAPYPGFKTWFEDESYKLVDSKLFDWENRKARDRSKEVYEDAPMSELRDVVPRHNYLISKQLDL